MADTTKDFMRNVALILGVIVVCASPIIAVTLAATNSADAKATADEALELARENEKDFAFFKGEVNAKLDNLTKGQDRVIEFISNLEKTDVK